MQSLSNSSFIDGIPFNTKGSRPPLSSRYITFLRNYFYSLFLFSFRVLESIAEIDGTPTRVSSTCSRDHTEGLQPHAVAAERVFKVHGQFLAIAIGRTAIQPAGIRAEEEQAATTCRRTCRALAIVRHSRRHMGIHFKVRSSSRSGNVPHFIAQYESQIARRANDVNSISKRQLFLM